MTTPPVWRLRKGMDRRFRAGHPWVYSNELLDSPKGLPAGALVKLLDASGNFMALGFGNPNSLISFRSVTRNPEDLDPLSAEGLFNRLSRAGELRQMTGYKGVSHRLCFGEADELPGLVIDHYRAESGQVFVVQAHTAGADRLLNSETPVLLAALETYVLQSSATEQSDPKQAWNDTTVILRNDITVRKLEGLEQEEPKILKAGSTTDLQAATILVRSVSGPTPLPFVVNLLEGQKTGFFLDQFANIELAAARLQNFQGSSPIRILDLCCYVGQWGVQLGKLFKDRKLSVEVTAVDASATALEFAWKNLARQGIACNPVKMDVLKGLSTLPDQSFDLVISDPPALIKGRKDIPTGSHAYLQLATQALRLTRPGGAIVACSCSSLMPEETFSEILAKAAQRNNTLVQWVGRGAQSADHPMLSEFPEGRYLKGWVGILS